MIGAGESQCAAPRAVLLSGPFGLGHAAVAQAVRQPLRAAGWTVEELDSLRLMGQRAGAAGEGVFRALLRVPTVYDSVHFAHLRTGSRLAQLIDLVSTRALYDRLHHRLEQRPADLTVSVFATGASAVGRLPRDLAGTRITVCTDVVVHRLWLAAATDLYLVTSPAAEASIRKFLPDANVAVLPAPVAASFCDPLTREDARSTLGLRLDIPCVLLMGGGWGLGPVGQIAEALARRGIQVIAVAGHNARLAARLTAGAAQHPNLRAYGFAENIAELMAAADLVVTTPGVTTCAEARAAGRFLMLLDTVPGHGRDNLQHELARGAAAVCGSKPEAAANTIVSWLGRATDPPPVSGDWNRAFASALGKVGLSEARCTSSVD